MAALELDARGKRPHEWRPLLDELLRASVAQRRAGLPPLSQTSVRYQREPKRRERWQSAQRTYELGYGDCEDLATYLAADLIVAGIPAKVITKRVRPGLRHALTLARVHGRYTLIDPSRARGMGGRG